MASGVRGWGGDVCAPGCHLGTSPVAHRGVSILCRRRRLQSLPDLNLCKVGAATSVSQMVSLGPKGLVTAQGH